MPDAVVSIPPVDRARRRQLIDRRQGRIRVPAGGLVVSTDPITIIVPTAVRRAAAAWPVYDRYAAFVTARGGTPVSESNERMWGKPSYPTVPTSSPGSVSALQTAINSASAGDVILLDDGAYSDNTTITVAVSGTAENPITIAPRTLLGAVFSGNLKFDIPGSFINLLGMAFSGSSNVVEIIELSGSDNLVAYVDISGMTCTNANNNQFYFYISSGTRNRFTNCTYSLKLSNRAACRTTTTPTYARFDHIFSDRHRGGGGSGDDEAIQFAQDAAATNTFHLADNFYIYQWNNDGSGNRVSASENEDATNKSSSNMHFHHYLHECLGNLNDRESHRSVYYACIVDGGGWDQAGGIALGGDDSYAFCNYVVNVNNDGSDGQRGIAMRKGGTGTYEPSIRNEAAFNYISGSGRSLAIGEGGTGSTDPTDCGFYNNVVASPIGDSVNSYDGTGHVWEANTIAPTLGITPVPSGIDVEAPETTTDNGYEVPTDGGNLHGTGSTNHNVLCTVDLLGAAIPTDHPNRGPFQPGWDLSTDPAQVIIDNAGANA